MGVGLDSLVGFLLVGALPLVSVCHSLVWFLVAVLSVTKERAKDRAKQLLMLRGRSY